MVVVLYPEMGLSAANDARKIQGSASRIRYTDIPWILLGYVSRQYSGFWIHTWANIRMGWIRYGPSNKSDLNRERTSQPTRSATQKTVFPDQFRNNFCQKPLEICFPIHALSSPLDLLVDHWNWISQFQPSRDVFLRLRAPPPPALQPRSKPKAQTRLPARPNASPEPRRRRARGRSLPGRRACAAVRLRLPRAEAGAWGGGGGGSGVCGCEGRWWGCQWGRWREWGREECGWYEEAAAAAADGEAIGSAREAGDQCELGAEPRVRVAALDRRRLGMWGLLLSALHSLGLVELRAVAPCSSWAAISICVS